MPPELTPNKKAVIIGWWRMGGEDIFPRICVVLNLEYYIVERVVEEYKTKLNEKNGDTANN